MTSQPGQQTITNTDIARSHEINATREWNFVS